MNRQAAMQLDTHTAQSEYRIGKTIYRIADDNDDATLRDILCKTPMTSWVTLSSEHEANYFASSRLYGQRETLIAERNNLQASPVGMCSWTGMELFVNGKPSQTGYLGELRVLPEFRKRPGIVRNGFMAVHSLAPDYPHWFTSIAVDNTVARRLLEANMKGMPVYRPQGEMVTLALPALTTRKQKRLHSATHADVPELVEFYNQQAGNFQYAPVLTESWLNQLDGSNGLHLSDFQLLRENGQLRACFALWDQHRFKQTVVRGYRSPLAQLRGIYNLYARLNGKLKLPSIGQSIDYLFIAFLAVAPDTEKTKLRQVIDSALSQAGQRGVNCAMLGLATDNPLLEKLSGYHTQTYRTCIESVYWPDQANVDMLPAGRIVQPEIALL
ncbi:MAG: hypothetical protein AB2805_18480 [Candidatus Thiodiazotropha sp.]